MNSRALIVATRRLVTPQTVCARAARSMGHGHGHGHEVQRVTMNDLPVPEGSWQAHYEQQQKKYNRHLILGTAFFLFTCGIVFKGDIIQFNYKRPKLPDEE